MKQPILLVLLTITTAVMYAQDNEKLFNAAEAYLDDENYSDALKIYTDLLVSQQNNANIKFKIGYCYINLLLPKKAIPFLKEAVTNIDENETNEGYDVISAPLETYYFLGQAYHLDYQFQKSIDFLTLLKQKIDPKDKTFIQKIDQIINWDKNGLLLMKYPVKMDVTNLGDSINSIYDDHSPVFSADESVLMFTSRREGSMGGVLLEDNQYEEDIYVSYRDENGKWGKTMSIGKNVNTVNHDATIGLSVDGQTLLIYKDDNGDGNLYYSHLHGDIWDVPNKFPSPINSKSRETSASLSPDGNTLFFTSDRKGGLGGLDIYRCKKLPSGEWGIPQNLGATINTPYDDEAPYIHPDGVTLFFSSKDHQSMGGYDIFFSTYDEETGKWEEPTNIGYPINTTGDDVFYLPTPDGKRAYYASAQYGSKGKTDIYLLSLPEAAEKELTVMSGYVIAGDGTVPQNLMITVSDVEKQEEIGIYTPNSKTGKYLFILKPGKTYDILVEADNYLYHSEKIEVKKGTAYQQIKRAIKLDPIILGNMQANYFVKFPANSTKLTKGIISDLENMSKFMFVNDTMHLNIYMNDNSDDMTLNKKRKAILRKYIVDKGIKAERISTENKLPNTINLIILPDLSEKQLADNINNNDSTNNIDNTHNNVIPKQGDVVINNILFDFDKYATHAYDTELDKLVAYLIANTNAKIMINGHTDSQGSDEYNDALGLKRAQFVKDYLVSRGANKETISIKSWGEKKLVAIDLNPDTRQYNRRVEFQTIRQGTYKLIVNPLEIPESYKLK